MADVGAEEDMRHSYRMALSAMCLVASWAGAAEAAAPRLVSTSIGFGYNPSLGHATTQPPTLLEFCPELQVAWGMTVGDEVLLLARIDVLGGILPLFPFGAGADFVFGWSPDLGSGSWEALVRTSFGAMVFGSGGEGLGEDYTGAGFRLGLEAGVVHTPPASRHMGVSYGVVVGVQATLLSGIEPCQDGDDCADVFIGPSLRFETGLHF